MRLDQFLVKNNYFNSRALAQKMVAMGAIDVLQNGIWTTITKSAFNVEPNQQIKIIEKYLPKYVSRAGEKLEGAVRTTSLNLKGKTVLDIGQSTGGFTDYVLQQGATKVVGIDVGHDQLDKKIRDDQRVVFFEGVNARELDAQRVLSEIHGCFDFIVMDVSFISQTLILAKLVECMDQSTVLISLVKPQFEVGKDAIGKGGIVRDTRLYKDVEEKITQCCRNVGLTVTHYFKSPIEGGDGNREFFAIIKRA